MQNNLFYLDWSIKNPEKILDPFYMFVELDKNFDLYVKKTTKIKEILTVIKVMVRKKESEKVLDEYYKELLKELENFANHSEFVCFANACDLTIEKLTENLETLKSVTEFYLKFRSISEFTPSEWIQAMIDAFASRKKVRLEKKTCINFRKKWF